MFVGKVVIDADDPNADNLQVFPLVEKHLHNLAKPAQCWCQPFAFEYIGLDGKVDLTSYEHKWIQ